MRSITLEISVLVLVCMLELFKFDYAIANHQSCVAEPLDARKFNSSGNQGYAVKCQGYSRIPPELPGPNNTIFLPPVRLLDLSCNKLTRLNNSTFINIENLEPAKLKWLYLDNNNIQYIDPNAFSGLTLVEYLNLSNNALHWPGSYGIGLFKPLVTLDTLNVNGNEFKNFSGLGYELQVLNGSLTNLYIDAKEDCAFGPDFENLTSLVNVSLSSPRDDFCNLTHITNKTFKYIPQVKMLWVSSCNVEKIDPDAFSWFTGLELLDISYNQNLNFTGMNNALYGLRNSTTLNLLNVNHIYPFLEAGITLKAKHMENLKTLQALQTLHMDLNKLEVMEPKVLVDNYFPRSLRNLTLTGNRLTAGEYLKSLLRLENLTFLDISRQHLTYDPYFWEHFEPREYTMVTEDRFQTNFNQNNSSNDVVKGVPSNVSYSPSVKAVPSAAASSNVSLESSTSMVPSNEASKSKPPVKNCSILFPPSLTKLEWHSSYLHAYLGPLKACGATHVTHLNLAMNLIYEWTGPVTGIENLRHLNLSSNHAFNISDHFFSTFKSLEVLDISINTLDYSFDADRNNHSHFILQNLTNLKVLNMSNSGITNLHPDTFSNLVSLNQLKLANNMMNDWNVNLYKSRCLNVLDLSGNKLDTLSPATTEYLDWLTTQECNKGLNISLNISHNSVICSCDDLPFLTWIRDTKVQVHFRESDECRMKNKRYILQTESDFLNLLEILDKDCADKRWITYAIGAGSAVVGIIIACTACCLVYKKRWKLRYLYYSRHRRYRHTGYEHIFAHDAMVSYARSRAQFVKDNLYPALNDRGLNLWLPDKDSRVGISIQENITHAIVNSRKAVLLVDEDYLKDSWCDYEMNMALVESVESQRQLIIVVLIDIPDIDRLPLTMMRFLRNERSLEFPEHTQDMETFWTNLANEIET